MTTLLHQRELDTPIGLLTLVASDDGLAEVLFEGSEPSARTGHELAHGSANDADHPVLVMSAQQLTEYFAGERRAFDVPLLPLGTDFQLMCWAALDDIAYGQTVSYGDQATQLGKPTASRAVGSANGRNHLPIVRPCHRVIGANGSLTGFAGGIEAKRWLLDHEATHAGHRLL